MMSQSILLLLAQDNLREPFVTVIYFALLIVVPVSLWKVFAKAGQPGWFAIIPLLNVLVLLKVVGRLRWWWFLLLLLPLVGIYVGIVVANVVSSVVWIVLMFDLARVFGREGGGFAVGLILLPFVFFPILAFGSATFVGEAPRPIYLSEKGRVR